MPCRRLRSLILGLGLFGFLSGAPATSALQGGSAGQADSPEITFPPEVAAAISRASSAFGGEDVAAIAALYAADAWLRLPCEPLAVGRADIRRAWAETYARPNFSLEFEPLTVEMAGDGRTALERGRVSHLFLVGGIPYGLNPFYVRVWKREGRQWRIASDVSLPGPPCHED